MTTATASKIELNPAALRDLYETLKRAREELRLISMKDTGAVYDIGLRIQMDMALSRAESST